MIEKKYNKVVTFRTITKFLKFMDIRVKDRKEKLREKSTSMYQVLQIMEEAGITFEELIEFKKEIY